MKFIGIDWGVRSHVVSVVDEQGAALGSQRFDHNPLALTECMEWLDSLSPQAERSIGVEAGSFAIYEFLLERGERLYIIPPKTVERARDRHFPSGAKDDSRDAFVIADLLRTDLHRLRPASSAGDISQELKHRTRARARLVDKRASAQRELVGVLRQYYIPAVDLTTCRHQGWFLRFLREYPDPDAVLRARRKTLDQFLKENRVRSWTASTIQELVRTKNIRVRESSLKALRDEALDLVSEIVLLSEQIAAQETNIDDLLKQHPDHEIILSIPGFKETLAARVLAEIGDDRTQLKDDGSLSNQAGTAPITIQTGDKTKKRVKRRRAFNRSLHQAFYLQANASTRTCKWAKSFYQHRRSMGERHSTAARSLANKWAKILRAILLSGERYDDDRHTQVLLAEEVPWMEKAA